MYINLKSTEADLLIYHHTAGHLRSTLPASVLPRFRVLADLSVYTCLWCVVLIKEGCSAQWGFCGCNLQHSWPADPPTPPHPPSRREEPGVLLLLRLILRLGRLTGWSLWRKITHVMESGSDSAHVFMVLFLQRRRKEVCWGGHLTTGSFFHCTWGGVSQRSLLSEAWARVEAHKCCVGAHNLIKLTLFFFFCFFYLRGTFFFHKIRCSHPPGLTFCVNQPQMHKFGVELPPRSLGGRSSIYSACFYFRLKLGRPNSITSVGGDLKPEVDHF